MAIADPTGELSYNGYTFDGASHITTNVEMVYDDAKQIVIAHRVKIHVSFIVAQSGGTDDTMEDVKQLLGVAGQKLIFKDKGFGDDIKIGGSFSFKDIDGGPFPEVITWAPIGDDLACECEWTVTATIPVCGVRGRPKKTGVKSINWGVSYAMDTNGDTTRTFTGFIDVVVALSGRVVSATADQFREVFAPPLLLNFKRNQMWTVAPNKRRVNFTITDTQIPSNNPYPQFATAISGTHHVSWKRGGDKGMHINNTISMTVQNRAGMSGARAWDTFRAVVFDRAKYAESRGRNPFLNSLDIQESLFGREHSFSVSYWFISPLNDFVQNSGLWRPVFSGNGQTTRWDTWQASIRDIFGNRGTEGLRDEATDNILFSLCDNSGVVKPNKRQNTRDVERKISNVFINRYPPRKASYIEYKSLVEPIRENPKVRQAIIQTDPEGSSEAFDLNGPRPENWPSEWRWPQKQGRIPDVIQCGGASRDSIIFKGSATRAGYPVPRPSVSSVGGLKPDEKETKFQQSYEGNYFGVPVYKAEWKLKYLLDRVAPGFEPPTNFRDEKDAADRASEMFSG